MEVVKVEAKVSNGYEVVSSRCTPVIKQKVVAPVPSKSPNRRDMLSRGKSEAFLNYKVRKQEVQFGVACRPNPIAKAD